MKINQGFVLTRQARDRGNKTVIELWVSTPQGPVQLDIEGERPTFFIDTSNTENAKTLFISQNLKFELKSLPLKTFQDSNVTACYFTTIVEANMAITLLEKNEIVTYESDIRLADRYLMERFIKGSIEFTGHQVARRNQFYMTTAKCRPGQFKPSLCVVSLDIECSEKGVLYSIGLDCERDSRVIMVGQPEPAETPIQWVSDEKKLLLALNQWFQQFEPDVIVGWNIIDFDFRLLDRRAQWNKVPLAIGRNSRSAIFRSGRNQQGFISIPGRVVIDGIDMLKTATYHFRSWSLESVSQELLGEGKSIHNVHDRMEEINQMFRADKPSLAKYNLQDCILVNRIFDKTHLLDFAIERSCLTGLELDRVGGSVAAFTNLYLPQLHRAGYVAPNINPEEWIASPGGYVMDSLPGLYDSVLVLDYKSLYPAIIRSFLIDPLGLIEGQRLPTGNTQDSAIEGFRGGQFHREKHFLPKMVHDIWQARDLAKINNDPAFSQALKIIMNSFYGVLGSSGCRFFDTRLASSITMRGHEIMKTTKQLIEKQGYEVIYGDTDSTFVALNSAYSEKQADEIGKKLVEEINAWWKQELKQRFGINSYLELEYETHYRKFLMPTIRGSETGSKKRYAGLVGKNSDEKIVFKGLESARSDWTPLAQEFQQRLYMMVFHDQDPSEYVRNMVERTQAGEFDNMLTYQKRLRRQLHEYEKNIPPQVRAARIADEKNARLGRPLQYQNRGRIEYLMTVNGPEPKEYLESAIDYQHYIEKQLKPVAEAILPFVGYDFKQLSEPQLGLF
ncbi:DNA polymerase II [Vibrio parahaemolyticus]|uniref:DNA polymerase II n=1 Tax=Vibrio sp. B1ASS3 TaxID=2751176 RepID=UPI001ABA73A4|nr:DNA polymerase II [Vibrio sp. B1ASS3]CAD7805312.1 COG0417 DNA polymerase elongation subunit (family B) [Vibrio sp. B1ASS3]CAE6899304.1 COG0417 DNA polymerase elongation subunit (family B) [Vibrio sp. B1ASS3]